MGALANIYFKKETLQDLLDGLNKKQEKGVSITLSMDDNTNDWGQNVSGYVSQTKEQRDAKTPKFYVGNGSVFWTDGKVVIAEKKDKPVTQTQQPKAKW